LTARSDVTGPEAEEFGPPPELSERYRVVGALGRGGVGVVYRGWDEELGRPVAIKFLRPDRPGLRRHDPLDLATRLRRESMALAALSHPNVVAVYDVVEGKGGVGIVMELVEGDDLRTWLRASNRTTPEILGVFIQAARGLEAAHAEGFVHRDFKPGNVMVGEDGRVRVLDFGLARLVAAHPSVMSRHSGRHMVLSHGTNTDGLMTERGAVMGTPAYMAPEQMAGQTLDARTDQFSFCVALYEALAGDRPFDGRDLTKRRRAIAAGPPDFTSAPRRLREAIRTGLALDPDARHPSMRELIAVLEAASRPSMRWWWVAGLGALGVTAAFGLSSGQSGEGCDADDPSEVWTAARRGELEAAFTAVPTPYAADAWSKTAAGLEAYVEVWARERDQVCAASPPEPSRLACLDDVNSRFEAALDIFGGADADVVENAVALIQSLPSPADCDSALSALDDATLRPIYARARAEADAGRYNAALALSSTLLQQSLALENELYEALGLWLTGSIKDEQGLYDEALDALEDAYFVAVRVGAHRTAVHAALDAAGAAGLGARRPDEGRKWLRHARTQIERLDDPRDASARAVSIEGGIDMLAGDTEVGVERLERAHALLVELRGNDDVETANALNNLGLAYQEMGRFDEALDRHAQAQALFTRINGPDHPSTSNVRHALAGCQASIGKYDEAVANYQAVKALWEQELGQGHPRVAMIHYNIGHVHQAAGKNEPALEAYLRAIELLEPAIGRDHVNTAMAVHNAGSIHHELKQLDKAQDYLERSLAVFESAEVHPLYLAINRYELATVLHERGRDPERVEDLIRSSMGRMANGGRFEKKELDGIKEWISENRPDLADVIPTE
jgi:tetratricopeptide (TPR) repeat protein/predicted Ser/Thr protein kinase